MVDLESHEKADGPQALKEVGQETRAVQAERHKKGDQVRPQASVGGQDHHQTVSPKRHRDRHGKEGLQKARDQDRRESFVLQQD